MTATVHHSPASSSHPGACQQACCGFDTLVRPRFFCGQLLTDTDLATLVNWTTDKLQLSRYRHGWGVVCGLDVRCDPDPEHAGGVIINPGYAISCCGDDIIVPADHHYDLGGACRLEPDPCADPRTTKTDDPESDRQPVDLYLCYHEKGADPQTALAHCACGDGGACHDSRTQEQFDVTCRRVEGDLDPVSAIADRWERDYDQCLELVTAFLGQFRGRESYEAEQVRSIQRWLLKWIDGGHPLHQLCLLRDRICQLDGQERVSERDVAELLFLLVQDCRNAYLTCFCSGCEDTPGVRLARVWLRRDDDRRCHVERIDPYPPYRRTLSTACWPAPLGWVNAAQVVWHRWEEACTRLADLGVNVVGTTPFNIPSSVADLKAALNCRPFIKCGEGVTVQVYELDVDGSTRVVGFCGIRDDVTDPRQQRQDNVQRTEPSRTTGNSRQEPSQNNTTAQTQPHDVDVEQVRGVGPSFARTLREAGFRTCRQLSQASIGDLRRLFPAIVTREQLQGWIRDAAEKATA
jgi:predicted flap endonuclease-1-like 5' DNA nuclease